MPTLPISLPTGLFGTADYPWTVTVGGTVVDPEWPTLELEEDAFGETSYFKFRVWDADSSLTINERMVVRSQDNALDVPNFLGLVHRRKYRATGRGRWIEVEARSIVSYLDEIMVPGPYLRPAGESDKARLLFFWGLFAREPLSGDVGDVTSVNASLDADLFVNLTLRAVIDQIAGSASETVRWYVDSAGRPHYFATSEGSLTAPYNVNVAVAPGGGNIAPDDLDLSTDGKIVNRVYVRGANAGASGWYSDPASIALYGIADGYLDAPNCETTAKAGALARMYLGKVSTPNVRGEFSTGHPYTGWRAGQSITITSPQEGLASYATRIVRVTHGFWLGDGKRQYRIEFGRPRARSTAGAFDLPGVPGVSVPYAGQVLGGEVFSTNRVQVASTTDPTDYGELVYNSASDVFQIAKLGDGTINLRGPDSGTFPSSIQLVAPTTADGALVFLGPFQSFANSRDITVAGSSIDPGNTSQSGLALSLRNTTGAGITITAAPTVLDPPNSATAHQLLILVNRDANNIVLQDRGTLANSNLRLGAATRTLGAGDVLTLLWVPGLGDWCEVSFVNNL